MANSGSGDGAAHVTDNTAQPSTEEVLSASPKTTRRAGQSTKRINASPTEALEILTSALEICRQAGIQVRLGNLRGQLLVGISLYPAEVEVTDGKHIIRPGAL